MMREKLNLCEDRKYAESYRCRNPQIHLTQTVAMTLSLSRLFESTPESLEADCFPWLKNLSFLQELPVVFMSEPEVARFDEDNEKIGYFSHIRLKNQQDKYVRV